MSGGFHARGMHVRGVTCQGVHMCMGAHRLVRQRRRAGSSGSQGHRGGAQHLRTGACRLYKACPLIGVGGHAQVPMTEWTRCPATCLHHWWTAIGGLQTGGAGRAQRGGKQGVQPDCARVAVGPHAVAGGGACVGRGRVGCPAFLRPHAPTHEAPHECPRAGALLLPSPHTSGHTQAFPPKRPHPGAPTQVSPRQRPQLNTHPCLCCGRAGGLVGRGLGLKGGVARACRWGSGVSMAAPASGKDGWPG